MIPCAAPQQQYLAHKDEIDEAIARVLQSGWYILGKEVACFEEELATHVGVAHAVGVGSGTEALHLALVACGIGPGDEVITVSHTAVATIAAIVLAGARPVFVDIDPMTYSLDPTRLESAVTARTKAILPVHLYGHPANMQAILAFAEAKHLRVIEDCAQAQGALLAGRRVGSFGEMGCFSFYPTKNVGALGDGGAVVTNDDGLAGKVRMLREYGWRERFVSDLPGWNSRLDELQAAILRVKLGHLQEDIQKRHRIAQRYDEAFADLPMKIPRTTQGVTHAYHLYVIRSTQRDGLREHLKKRDIHTGIHYPVPIHLQPAYSQYVRKDEALAETERAANEVLSLPMFPELSGEQVTKVIAAVRDYAHE